MLANVFQLPVQLSLFPALTGGDCMISTIPPKQEKIADNMGGCGK